MTELKKLEKFFEKIKTIGFFERLFSWKKTQSLSFDAHEEYISLKENMGQIVEVKELRKKLENLQEENKEQVKKITEFETTEKQRQKEFEEKISNFLKLEENFEKKEETLRLERGDEITQRFEDMKNQWKIHEDLVEQVIKQICSRYTMDYISKTKVPFKGSPDNCIQIAGEYIIFDAKALKMII